MQVNSWPRTGYLFLVAFQPARFWKETSNKNWCKNNGRITDLRPAQPVMNRSLSRQAIKRVGVEWKSSARLCCFLVIGCFNPGWRPRVLILIIVISAPRSLTDGKLQSCLICLIWVLPAAKASKMILIAVSWSVSPKCCSRSPKAEFHKSVFRVICGNMNSVGWQICP